MDLILDENIIVFAAKNQDQNGQTDRSCMGLLFDILDRCDIVHCSNTLYNKYRTKLDSLNKANYTNSYAVRVLIHILQLGKLRIHDEPPPLKDDMDEKAIPPDDIFLIRLSAQTKAIVITSDLRLINRLEEANILNKYGIQLRRPVDIK